jgi:hypothetical protein
LDDDPYEDQVGPADKLVGAHAYLPEMFDGEHPFFTYRWHPDGLPRWPEREHPHDVGDYSDVQ